MFVGIDEYDAPANNSAFDGSGAETEQHRRSKVSEIEVFFKSSLFSVLKNGCSDGDTHAISKYFLTGVLPAFRSGMSPLTATEIISTRAEFHGICGFNSDQVKVLGRAFLSRINKHLDYDHIYQVMDRYYGGYRFARPSEAQLDTLSNPQLIYHFLAEFKSHGHVSRPGESPAVHTTKVLKSIADTGDFSIEDIIQLMATGFLVSDEIIDEFGYADLVTESRIDRITTLSLLVHLGVLTRDDTGKQLRIPNHMMKSQVYKPTLFLSGRMLNRRISGISPHQGVYRFPGGYKGQNGACK